MATSVEVRHQVIAVLFIATLAGAEVHKIRNSARFRGADAYMAGPNFQKQGMRNEQHMKSALVNTDIQESMVFEKMATLVAGPQFEQEMLNKVVARGLKASSFNPMGLEHAMNGKSSSLAIQPGVGLNSAQSRRLAGVPSAAVRADRRVAHFGLPATAATRATGGALVRRAVRASSMPYAPFELPAMAARGALVHRTVRAGSVSKPDPSVPPENEGASVGQSYFNLVKTVVGAGVLSLPAGMAAGTGLVPAICSVATLGLYAGYTFSLMGRVCEETGKRTFQEVGLAAEWNRRAMLLDVACIGKTLVACLSFSIILSQGFADIGLYFGVPPWLASRNIVLLGLTTFVLVPLALLRDMSKLAFTSLLGSAGMLYTAIFMVIRYFDGSYLPGGRFYQTLPAELLPTFGSMGIDYFSVSTQTLTLIASLATAFTAHYNAPKFYDQLANRSVARFNVATFGSFASSIILYLLVMLSGYLTFGTAAQGSILNSYSTLDPLAAAARVAVCVALLFTYPLVFTGARDGTMSLLGWKQDSKRFYAVHYGLFALITSAALVVKDFGFVASLGGAIFGTFLIYIAPASLFLYTQGERFRSLAGARFETVWARVTVILGIFMMILGSIVSVLGTYFPEVLKAR